MAGLDFRRAAELFMGSRDDLAQGLGIDAGEVDRYREKPDTAPDDVMERMATVLQERGRGMIRVGEMLQERQGG